MPAAGTQAPDFELLNHEGVPTKLSDFRGQTVILFAFPRVFTSGCTTQACGMRDNYPVFETHNAVVIGISPDIPDELKRWKEHENLPYLLVSDPEHQVLEAWGAWGEKSMYGKKYQGVIRSHWVIGPDGVVIDEQLSISPQKSVEKALQAVEG